MISIIHPSRSRADQAFETMYQWLVNMSRIHNWEYILSVDSNDPKLSEYEGLGISGMQNVKMIVNDNQNIVQASNQAAKLTNGDIIVLVSDDFISFKNWDIPIVSALEGRSGVLKTYDGIQRWIVTLPIMTRDYYEEQGHIYDPAFEHLFPDTQLTHIADLTGNLIIRNDIVFKHNHYSTSGEKKDIVSIKADSTWDSGKRTYLTNCKNKFGLSQDIDIFNLSDTAKKSGHLKWLKNELRIFKG